MRTKQFFLQLISCLLIAVMLCSLIPITAFASDDADLFNSTTTAIVKSGYLDTKQLKIESYLTNETTTDVTIKPCDIIFVMDQSKWMNTADNAGEERATIISYMKNLLSTVAVPTTGGEHRVAIAGYGRVNVNGRVDPYDAATYPGQVPTSTSISFNTGYYTTNGFISKNGWTEVGNLSGTALPQMPDGYLTDESYENTFMTLSEAESVLNPDTMMAWYAGASRMDAGLTIAEQLANIAKNHNTNDDRNLIICIMASSLPIHNNPSQNQSIIRNDAVIAASENLKALGATIFAFGNYHSSGRTMSGTVQDTEENFTSIMQSVCTKPDYYYSLSDYSNITEAMNNLITQITITSAGEANREYTVTADSFTVSGIDIPIEGTIDENGVKTVTWKSIRDYYGDRADDIISTATARVDFYNFTGYDSNGEPTFEKNARISLDVPFSDMYKGDTIAYDTTMIPLPAKTAEYADSDAYNNYGYKVVITIASPITVTYEWASRAAGYAPSRAAIPGPEVMAVGTTHAAPTIRSSDEHYIFDGWYTDETCTSAYSGETTPITNFTLYGKWSKYVLIEYYWDIWNSGYDYPDADARITYGETPSVYTPDGVEGYMFDGWYLDKDYTVPYVSEPLTEDIQLYAKWLPNADTEYTVKYYKQNISDDEYTEVSSDTLHLNGKTDEQISPITKAYQGFTLSHITYEDSANAAQTTPLTIKGDGSLTVKVYFNRNEYRVTYDGNGSDSGTVPVDTTAYRYGATVTVKDDTMTRKKYAFTEWNTESDGSGISYAPNKTFVITGNTTLIAQWTPKTAPVESQKASYRVEHYKGQLDGSYILAETEFPLYGTAGTTVTAAAKDFEHYRVNEDVSTLSGTVVMPTVENGETVILTLQVYYDLETVDISYDLNGGNGKQDVDYSTETVKYGTTVTVKDNPTRDGYTFIGWTVGDKTYLSGESVTMTENITLVAKWQENSKPSNDSASDEHSPKTADQGNLLILFALMLIGGAVLAVTTAYTAKKKIRE